ncbi:hypothetical protein JKY72_05295 [Candidatus Gracilibacteria bacterium]|nr:hypothetical protein [Candidatus Gracilibacteria bacterium]
MSKKLFIITAIAAVSLSACSTKSYDIEVDLSEEMRTDYEATIVEYSEKFDSFETSINEDGTPDLPDFEWFVQKSRAEKELGYIDDSIATLEEAIEVYSFSSIALHNLGKIYQNAGECKLAEDYFVELTKIEKPQYNYDIAYCYMKQGKNRSKVEEYYFKYRVSFPDNHDPEVEDYLAGDDK